MKLLSRRPLIAAGTSIGLALAGAARLGGASPAAVSRILLVTLLACGLPVVLTTARGLFRGRFAADVVAMLAIVGAALLGQYFAGTIIVLMQAGGEALDDYAMHRASRSLEALLSRAPKVARRRRGDAIDDVPADAVVAGDELVLRPGDMVPVDCDVLEGRSSVDQSALTGEPMPVAAAPGTSLSSGTLNLDGALVVRATRPAGQSQYQQIVRLVESARAGRAPIQRVADRFAIWFTPFTLVMCLIAWLVDHQATSVLAVLVVATPCPLILATPVAMIAGIGRAAARGIIVRNGAALEAAGRARVVVFDKTGTLTLGQPTVETVVATGPLGQDEMLRLAATVEQLSSHHLGQAIAREGRRRFGALGTPADVREFPGEGVAGVVDGRHVAVGSARWVGDGASARGETADPAVTAALVAVDGVPAGEIRFADRLRPEAPALMAALRSLGITRTVMLSGDRSAAVAAIAEQTGIATVHAGLLPAGKVEKLGELRRSLGSVVMVGDGINDAPALAAASVGIAMGAHAPAAAAEAADIVLLVDDVGRVAEAIAIGRRTRQIALQSIGVGLGVSAALMVVAAFGHIVPAAGALLQEALDVAVILNALRARHAPSGGSHAPSLFVRRGRAARAGRLPLLATRTGPHRR
jgi:heavy metal translocating P-type ATPase